MGLSRDQMVDVTSRSYDAERFHAHDARRSVVEIASHVSYILKGTDTDVVPFERPAFNRDGVDPNPAGIPGIRRERHFEEFTYHKVDSIGSYVVEQNPNVQPSILFNAGFYAGVLAARDGLVDTGHFTEDFGGRELLKPDLQ
jgi:hypothetical protein